MSISLEHPFHFSYYKVLCYAGDWNVCFRESGIIGFKHNPVGIDKDPFYCHPFVSKPYRVEFSAYKAAVERIYADGCAVEGIRAPALSGNPYRHGALFIILSRNGYYACRLALR